GHFRVCTGRAYGVLFADLVEEDDLAVADAEGNRAALAAAALAVAARARGQRELGDDLAAVSGQPDDRPAPADRAVEGEGVVMRAQHGAIVTGDQHDSRAEERRCGFVVAAVHGRAPGPHDLGGRPLARAAATGR